MKQINIKVDVPDGFVLDKIETEGNNIIAFVKEKEKFKRGDVVTLIDDNLYKESIVILEDVAKSGYWPIGTIRGFTIKSSKINRNAAYNKCYLANSRLATPSEAQLLFDALAKKGERWNAEKLQIEEREVTIDDLQTFEACCKFLGISTDLPDVSKISKRHSGYIQASYMLAIINEAWNKVDQFTPDYSNLNQRKWYPYFVHKPSAFAFDLSLCASEYSSTGSGSRLCFKSEERAGQFGKQFIDLYNTILLFKD